MYLFNYYQLIWKWCLCAFIEWRPYSRSSSWRILNLKFWTEFYHLILLYF